MKIFMMVIIYLMISTVMNTLYAATVSGSISGSEKECKIDIQGEIDSKTPNQVLNQINALKQDCEYEQFPGKYNIMIDFFSLGGDVFSAIKLGDLIRSNNAKTFSIECASACVIASIAGVDRDAIKIGLHRPFPVDTSDSSEQARKKRDIINQELQKYFMRMGIPQRLLDEMNSIPSGDIRWLNVINKSDENELKSLHVIGEDAVWADNRDSLIAKYYKISLQELYARRQKSRLCGLPNMPKEQYEQLMNECAMEGLELIDCGEKVLVPVIKKCQYEIMNGLR